MEEIDKALGNPREAVKAEAALDTVSSSTSQL